ncbi:MAG: sigma-70 family RNA polymerase sigma factor, partial [Verrucomicrobiaceae bacterium]
MSNRDSVLLPPDSDAALFTRYQAAPTGETFRLLAGRHLPLIWSTARRLVNGDAALAEDVSQIVLTDFARKAPQLPPGTVAAGWLHRHTCFTARKMVRTEIRRRAREHSAAELHRDIDQDPAMPSAAAAPPDSAWSEAAPFLDAALDQLSKSDREALLLRFYQRQDHRSVGAVLGYSEEAARKRIARALEKLRTLFRRRGIVLTAALLAQFLTDHASAAVPVGPAATLPGAAWRQATAAGPLSAARPLISLIRRFSLPAAAVVLI